MKASEFRYPGGDIPGHVRPLIRRDVKGYTKSSMDQILHLVFPLLKHQNVSLSKKKAFFIFIYLETLLEGMTCPSTRYPHSRLPLIPIQRIIHCEFRLLAWYHDKEILISLTSLPMSCTLRVPPCKRVPSSLAGMRFKNTATMPLYPKPINKIYYKLNTPSFLPLILMNGKSLSMTSPPVGERPPGYDESWEEEGVMEEASEPSPRILSGGTLWSGTWRSLEYPLPSSSP